MLFRSLDPGHKDQHPGYKDLDPGYKDQDPGYKVQDPGEGRIAPFPALPQSFCFFRTLKVERRIGPAAIPTHWPWASIGRQGRAVHRGRGNPT